MRYSSRSDARRRGLTLVEVVLGMTLLATLLVTLLGSFNSQRDRIHNAGLRMEACNAADQLLSEWMSTLKPFPQNESGTWNERWTWRSRLSRRDAFQSIPLNVVVLEIRDTQRPSVDPLVSVEVVVYAPEATVQ